MIWYMLDTRLTYVFDVTTLSDILRYCDITVFCLITVSFKMCHTFTSWTDSGWTFGSSSGTWASLPMQPWWWWWCLQVIELLIFFAYKEAERTVLYKLFKRAYVSVWLKCLSHNKLQSDVCKRWRTSSSFASKRVWHVTLARHVQVLLEIIGEREDTGSIDVRWLACFGRREAAGGSLQYDKPQSEWQPGRKEEARASTQSCSVRRVSRNWYLLYRYFVAFLTHH